ncbi:pyridoxamine 5'-phosphate oxidase family protein [Streptomyces sp. CB02460]|uniref:pyridoxamine 5'-phosphate oxidase family protein n=1 Tax=Streptomyces sp. CB02460 TaxID=1703941 RepID=UPI0013017DAA|nr:pyridoxamine 5'-phosphate oxidase family protein [Streptomyces sp. CB02460]
MEDLVRLQELIDDSARRASPSLRASFGLPAQSLSAAQLVRRCDGVFQVVLATVTASGAPRCAPVGALFVAGRLYVPTGAGSHRARNIAERPALSMSLSDELGFALIVHGRGQIMGSSDSGFAAVEDAQYRARRTRVSDWGQGVFIAVEAESLFTYARDPAAYPQAAPVSR